MGMSFFSGLFNTMYYSKMKYEAKILDSTLYIPALSPAHGLDKLLRLLEGDDTLWLEFLDKDRVDKVSTAAVKEWDKLHFRYYLLIGPIRGQQVINSVQSETLLSLGPICRTKFRYRTIMVK